jgi:hypothetical protein
VKSFDSLLAVLIFNICPVANTSVEASAEPEEVVIVITADGLFLFIFVIKSFDLVSFVIFFI